MAKKDILEEEDKVFLDYIKRRPNSVGKRFITYHIEQYGFEAFESFWQKISDRRDDLDMGMMNPAPVELSKREAHSLAKAIYSSNRREILEGIAGGIMLSLGIVSTGMATHSFADAATSLPPISLEKCIEIIAETTIGLPSLIIGLGLTLKKNPSSDTIADIAKGPEGEKNVADLVSGLDAMFTPVEAALAEANPRGKYAERAR